MLATYQTICKYCEMTDHFPDEIVGATEEELLQEIANMVTMTDKTHKE